MPKWGTKKKRRKKNHPNYAFYTLKLEDMIVKLHHNEQQSMAVTHGPDI